MAEDIGVAETESERLDRLGIYGEIKRELIKRGIPADEIAFIHDFDTPTKKAQAFAEVNAGKIRILLASTEKAGTGVNMQERLYALHHLDAPWRPADVEQREGRILRQGNRYGEVLIFNYVTENSFDGGEPFLQPTGLLALLQWLKAQGQHITLYTGFTLEELQQRDDASTQQILALTDILIDGPFVKELASNAGEWRGSTNQRILHHPAQYLSPTKRAA